MNPYTALFTREVTPQIDAAFLVVCLLIGLVLGVTQHYAYAGTLRPYVNLQCLYMFVYTLGVAWVVTFGLGLAQAVTRVSSPTAHDPYYGLWFCVSAGLAGGARLGSYLYIRLLVCTGRV